MGIRSDLYEIGMKTAKAVSSMHSVGSREAKAVARVEAQRVAGRVARSMPGDTEMLLKRARSAGAGVSGVPHGRPTGLPRPQMGGQSNIFRQAPHVGLPYGSGPLGREPGRIGRIAANPTARKWGKRYAVAMGASTAAAIAMGGKGRSARANGLPPEANRGMYM